MSISDVQNKADLKKYTTDSKVNHFSAKEDHNTKLTRILGKKFADYRERWNKVNKFELITDFPLFLHVELNQKCNYECPHCIIGDANLTNSMFNEKENIGFEQYKKICDEGAKNYINVSWIAAQEQLKVLAYHLLIKVVYSFVIHSGLPE